MSNKKPLILFIVSTIFSGGFLLSYFADTLAIDTSILNVKESANGLPLFILQGLLLLYANYLLSKEKQGTNKVFLIISIILMSLTLYLNYSIVFNL